MEKNVTVCSFTDPVFSCNTFVLSSPQGVIVIDPGYYRGKARNYIKGLGKVDAVLLTHAHWDHTRDLDALKKDFPDARVCLHKTERDFLTDGELNCSGHSIADVEIEEIEEGTLSVSGYEIEVIHTPGHTIGGCMYHFLHHGILVVGDVLVQKETFGTTFRPTGDPQALIASCKKVLAHGFPDDTLCLCGHGADISYTQLKKMFMKAEELVK